MATMTCTNTNVAISPWPLGPDKASRYALAVHTDLAIGGVKAEHRFALQPFTQAGDHIEISAATNTLIKRDKSETTTAKSRQEKANVIETLDCMAADPSLPGPTRDLLGEFKRKLQGLIG